MMCATFSSGGHYGEGGVNDVWLDRIVGVDRGLLDGGEDESIMTGERERGDWFRASRHRPFVFVISTDRVVGG